MRIGLKVGDSVRVLRVPSDVSASARKETKQAFQIAVGKTYTVLGTNEIGWLELELGTEVDRALGTVGNSIWIEPDCVAATGK